MKQRKSICIPAAPPVDISDFIPIIDHATFQRLRNIRQLGINDLIFPGAQHSRFEHALGVLSLTQRLCQLQGIAGHNAKLLQCFALLHDIGHGPYSHQLEPVLTGNHHEKGEICIGKMADAISACGLNPQELCDMLNGTNPLATWITDRNLGTDKLDYLRRDALHIGFQGVPDIERIQFYTRESNGQLMLDERLLEDGKQLQRFYSYLHQHGYLNKTALTAQRVLQRAVQEALMAEDNDGNFLWHCNDWQAMEWLRNCRSELARKLINSLENRNLPKTFLTLKPTNYGFVEKTSGKALTVIEMSRRDLCRLASSLKDIAKVRAVEDAIANEFGMKPGDVLLSAMPYFTKLVPKDITIFTSENTPSFSLFEKDKDHVTALESDYLRTFAIQLAVLPRQRRKLAAAGAEIAAKLLDL